MRYVLSLEYKVVLVLDLTVGNIYRGSDFPHARSFPKAIDVGKESDALMLARRDYARDPSIVLYVFDISHSIGDALVFRWLRTIPMCPFVSNVFQ